MGKPRFKVARKWKGNKFHRMARLVEFTKKESELFEALSVVFFGADTPEPKEIKTSIKAEDLFIKHGKETKDSIFKLAKCPLCGMRAGINPRIYTLPENTGCDLIMDDKVFDYIFSRFDKWQAIIDNCLKRPFSDLQDRFEKAKKNEELDDYNKIAKYIATRDQEPVLQADSKTAG